MGCEPSTSFNLPEPSTGAEPDFGPQNRAPVLDRSRLLDRIEDEFGDTVQDSYETRSSEKCFKNLEKLEQTFLLVKGRF